MEQVNEEVKMNTSKVKLPSIGGNSLQSGNAAVQYVPELKNIAAEMFKVMKSTSKNNIPAFTEEVFKRYILTLHAMNQHPEYDSNFIGVPTERWMVPNLFSNLVFPCAASAVADAKFPSLIDTNLQLVSDVDVEKYEALTHSEFEMVTSWIYGLLGYKSNEYQTMAKLRMRVTFSSIIDNLVEDNMIHWGVHQEKPFYFVSGNISVWDRSELTTHISDYILARFTAKWHSLYRSGSLDK